MVFKRCNPLISLPSAKLLLLTFRRFVRAEHSSKRWLRPDRSFRYLLVIIHESVYHVVIACFLLIGSSEHAIVPYKKFGIWSKRYHTTPPAQSVSKLVHHGGSRGKWYSRLKICQATPRPCSTTSKACSLVKGNSSRMGHKSKGRSKGRSASCSPCTDVSPPDGGFGRGSRLGECGEVTSIIVTDAGAFPFRSNGTSES